MQSIWANGRVQQEGKRLAAGPAARAVSTSDFLVVHLLILTVDRYVGWPS